MGKPLRISLIMITFSLVFIGGIAVAQKGGSRVIYEEETSFKDAKRRAKVISELKAQSSKTEDKSQKEQSPAEGLKGNIMSLIEKFFGKDAAGLLNDYGKGSSEKQMIGLEEETEKGVFKEFPDEDYKWKGIRRE